MTESCASPNKTGLAAKVPEICIFGNNNYILVVDLVLVGHLCQQPPQTRQHLEEATFLR